MLLGAHMSVAGGVDKAILKGEQVGCDVIQLFTKNNNRWMAKPLTRESIEAFKKNISRTGIFPFASHDAYLINLAATDPEIYRKSMEAFLDELDRAEMLDIPGLVFHPGSHVGSGEKEGIKKIAESLRRLLDERPGYKVKLLLETTAGQGSSIGYWFEHLAEIMEKVNEPERLGVCFDTCHVFAAGYDISNKKGYDKTFKDFEDIVGLQYIEGFHLNDSKKGLGSRFDRHEHIGKGELGIKAFELLMNDERFESTPMALETPKGPDMEEDRMNLKVLRGLIRKSD